MTIVFKVLFPLIVAILAVTSSGELLPLLVPEISSAEGIDGARTFYGFLMVWTIGGAILSGSVRFVRLLMLRRTYPLNYWVISEHSLRAGVLGGGAASGFVAVLVTFLRGMIDYVQMNGSVTPESIESIVYMGLIPAYFALLALAYSVKDAVLKPPKTANGGQ